ncbi:MAG: NAD(P)H-hydrate epimerase [Eggerthellaceae bacterium]|nr:NAD(P)H-hydrate epimerase [Eggerthellaceae bacterium]
MNVYLINIRTAFMLFPLVAALFTVPWMVYRYRRFGSIPWLRALGVYSFILYLMCVYFLVLLPLPADRTAVVPYAAHPQLVPFHFLKEFAVVSPFVASEPSTWLPTVKAFWATQYDVLFNVLMTVPLGMYLRYFFRRPWWQVLALGFAATLSFELSQLTGLWGLYEHPYRLFDVDDLIVNTAGALLGAALVTPLMHVLPDMRLVEVEAEEAGVRASAPRRAVSFGVDLALVAAATCALLWFVPDGMGQLAVAAHMQGSWTWACAFAAVAGAATIGYFVLLGVVPAVTRGRTLGQMLVKLVVVRPDGSFARRYQPLARYGLLYLLLAVPGLLLVGIVVLNGDTAARLALSPEARSVATFVSGHTKALVAAWCALAGVWMVSLVVRAEWARRRNTSFIMLNGLMSNTRVMTVEGARIARERNEVLHVSDVVALEQRLAAQGTPLRELMERAGGAAAVQVMRWVPDASPVVVLAGSGNNGGDGWVVARDLARKGYRVTLFTPKVPDSINAEPARSAAIEVFSQVANEKLPLSVVVAPEREQLIRALDEAAAVVDAMLGTGFSGESVREPYASWIEAANEVRFEGRRTKGRGRHRRRLHEGAGETASGASKRGARARAEGRRRAGKANKRAILPPKAPHAPFALAVDVPSGLSAETGRAANPCFAADLTVTMLAYKPGLVMPATTPYTGLIKLARLI